MTSTKETPASQARIVDTYDHDADQQCEEFVEWLSANGYVQFQAYDDAILSRYYPGEPGVPDDITAAPGDINDRTIHVTFFRNKQAFRLKTDELTLPQLAVRIGMATAKEKMRLPWLKLARFGNRRSAGDSLRNDVNMLEIHGIETEHDAGTIAFTTAVATMRQSKIRCLLYTSPSWVEASKEKWRILCPLAKPHPPEARAQLVACINGVFGGAITNECFDSSRAYLFGHVGEAAHHEAVLDGDFLDLRDDLDAGAVGKAASNKSNGKARAATRSGRGAPGRSDEEITALLKLSRKLTRHGDKQWHNRMLEATASMVGRGWTDSQIYDATEPYCDDGWGDRDVETMISGARAKRWGKPEFKGGPLFDDILGKRHDASQGENPEAETNAKAQEYGLFQGEDPEAEAEAETNAKAQEYGLFQGEDPYADQLASPTIKTKLMQTSAQFVAGFVPPDYLIDGLLQRRFVYSFTSPTGGGKTSIALLLAAHVARGAALAGREVEKGRVLFFAGENPDDVRTRWIKLCEELGENPDALDVVFMPFTLDLTDCREQINAESAEHGPFSLLIVDTSAAYYSGDDENDNVALGNHARMLRTFVELPGGPTVIVTCHPTKTPDMNNLLPRGGGAFLAEVDGNLVCIKDPTTMVVEVTTHGKFRGPDFTPFAFRLVAGQSLKLKDSKGRLIWTISARSISSEEQAQIEKAGNSDQDSVLRAMLEQPGLSLTELAAQLGWLTMEGQANKNKVHRTMRDLQKAKLVERRRDGHFALTPKGQKEAARTPESLATILGRVQAGMVS